MTPFSLRLTLCLVPLVFGTIAACGPEDPLGTFANLHSDYVLTTTEPAFARTATVRLRYEDDWVPRACEGATFLTDEDHVIIEWRCRYKITQETQTGGLATFTGGLSDEDGDGTFTGTLAGFPFNPDNSIASTPVAAEFTMTPCAREGGGGPCAE
jgi:hypothetical protein